MIPLPTFFQEFPITQLQKLRTNMFLYKNIILCTIMSYIIIIKTNRIIYSLGFLSDSAHLQNPAVTQAHQRNIPRPLS